MATSPSHPPVPDINAFEERAAAEYDGGLSRQAAETLAARAQGLASADHDWQVLADYIVNRRLGAKP